MKARPPVDLFRGLFPEVAPGDRIAFVTRPGDPGTWEGATFRGTVVRKGPTRWGREVVVEVEGQQRQETISGFVERGIGAYYLGRPPGPQASAADLPFAVRVALFRDVATWAADASGDCAAFVPVLGETLAASHLNQLRDRLGLPPLSWPELERVLCEGEVA